MTVIIGFLLALPLLYFWLSADHWFARVVAFLLLSVVLGGIGAWIFGIAGPAETNYAWAGVLLGIAAAWPVSGLPTYVHRHRVRHASLELALR